MSHQTHDMKKIPDFRIAILHLIIPIILFIVSEQVTAAVERMRVQTDLGGFYIDLFSTDAPNTVQNFKDYVAAGDYDGMFFHRYAQLQDGNPFVLQTGGYYFDPSLGPFFGGGAQAIDVITANLPLLNEFSSLHPNTRGTIAMAKVNPVYDASGTLVPGTGPDSATSQWFINLVDNSASLDSTNGGYTVFAEVVGSGMQVVDEIATFGRLATCTQYEPIPSQPICPPFSQMPFRLQNNQYLFDNDTLFNVQSIGTDADGDGAIDSDEIDGDSAGGPDSAEPNVASAPLIENPSDTITVATPSAAFPLTDFTVLGNTYRITRPESRSCTLNGVDLAYGLTSFKVNGVTPGGSVAVNVIMPMAASPSDYYFYGQEWLTPGNYAAVADWYKAIPYTGSNGVSITGNMVTLHLTDGGWGDADKVADGVITVAPGGPVNTIPPSMLADSDCDGVDDSVEFDAANNIADSNNDGIPDANEASVAFLPDLFGKYLTIESLNPSQKLESVRVSDGVLILRRASIAPLAQLNVPSGIIDFGISNLPTGGSARLKITMPAGTAVNQFYLLGPDTGNLQDQWYRFTNDGTTGASASGNQVTLDVVDGGRGDRDGVQNGVIYLIGIPAETIGLDVSKSGGGGCSVSTVATAWQGGAWWLMLLSVFAYGMRRTARSIPVTRITKMTSVKDGAPGRN